MPVLSLSSVCVCIPEAGSYGLEQQQWVLGLNDCIRPSCTLSLGQLENTCLEALDLFPEERLPP